MKVTYYNYFLQDRRNPNGFRVLKNLGRVLSNFCEYPDVLYKNSFQSGDGERVFLIKHDARLFTFVNTRDNDIIKAIDSGTLSCDDIHERLSRDESVGFASYFFIGMPYYAFASTLKGPKNNSFVDFVNDILCSQGIERYKFVSEAMMTTTTKNEAIALPFIGRTRVDVDPSNSFGQAIAGFLGLGNSNEVDSFEVTIKPKPRRNLKHSGTDFIENIQEQGLKKFVIRAKHDLEEQLSDFFVTTQGAVYDTFDKGSESEILNRLSERVSSNELLNSKLEQIENDDLYIEQEVIGFDRLSEPCNWTSDSLGR